MTREAGKGSKMRQTNNEAYAANFDRIFRSRPLQPIEEYAEKELERRKMDDLFKQRLALEQIRSLLKEPDIKPGDLHR